MKNVKNGNEFSSFFEIIEGGVSTLPIRVAKTSQGPIPQSFLISGYKFMAKNS